MGSQGMRRKGRRHLSKVESNLSEADTARALGTFRWSPFSPAGQLERNGFFWRQVSRQRGSARGRVGRAIAYTLAAAWGTFFAIALLVWAVRGLWTFLG